MGREFPREPRAHKKRNKSLFNLASGNVIEDDSFSNCKPHTFHLFSNLVNIGGGECCIFAKGGAVNFGVEAFQD